MQTAMPLDENAGPVLDLLAYTPFAWFSDIDGTLSPIVERPELATVHANMRRLLRQIAGEIDHLVFVSGRAPAHARDMVGVAEATYIGNHGLSWLQGDSERTIPEAAPYVASVAEIARRIDEAVRLDGLVIENKGPVLGLHYRQSSDPIAARSTLLDAAQRFGEPLGMRVYEGRKVIELRPPLTRDKGVAIYEFVRERGVAGAVYVGDDITDIDAFRALRSLRDAGEANTASVAVAEPEVDERVLREAGYHVEGIAGVERLLQAVVDALSTDEIG